ncbi:NAC domain containing protein 50-like [Silene latifolia]|uniref:NAC domain containing protein 50-like n=1 Tax=Silene latifolia TaxID=37657 RepID=UPI003D77DCDF
MAAYDLPLGYKFEPSKEELVEYFLKRRLRGEPLESFYNNVIMDFDVYHPSKIMTLTERKVEEDGFQQGYFFSSLETTSKNGKRIKHQYIPTHGTWLEKAATKMICYQNEVIGIHKYYKFNPVSESKGSMLNKDEWMMHEYSLLHNQDNQDQDIIVLCHITNKKDYNNSHNKSIKARKINMVVDQSLDYEAGPSKISRVDPYTEWNDEDPLNWISYDVGDECATADGGVKDDESLKWFEDGYKSAMEQIVAQEDHHDDHQVIEIPAVEMAAGELTWTTSNLDPRAQEELNRLEALLMA